MKIEHVVTTALIMSASVNVEAQYPIIGTTDLTYTGLISLENAGPKLMEFRPTNSCDTIRLLNLDLSLYKEFILTVPSGLLGYANPRYVTESLFDNDPSTVELLMYGYSNVGICTTDIIREDGTLVFSAPGMLGSDAYVIETAQSPIFNNASGAVMILKDCDGVGATAYQLPGHVPCDPCSDMGMGYGTNGASTEMSGIHAFPNPAVGEATISYEVPQGTAHATLVFSALNGTVVSRTAITSSGTKTITTADLAAGTYLYHLETERGIIGAQRLVVVK